jgi:hypothetical protein
MSTRQAPSHFDTGIAAAMVGAPLLAVLLFTHARPLLFPLVAVGMVLLGATRLQPDASRRRIAVIVGLFGFVLTGGALVLPGLG